MSCRSHSSLSRLGLSQVRLVLSLQTGSEKAPTGDQQVPKWLEGTCGVIGSHTHTQTDTLCSSGTAQWQTVILV